jgi:hypothetical protein
MTHRITALLVALGASACSAEQGEGTLRVVAYGEDFIEAGIPADAFVDGWAVTFTRFEIALAEVSAAGVSGGGEQRVDVTTPTGGDGRLVTELAVPSGTVGELAYAIAPDGSGSSIVVEGTATRETQTVSFAWTFATDTLYSPCHTEAEVPADGEATATITIHGDHLFYDDLVSADPFVAFDLVASADTDGDGAVTEAELRAVDINMLERYQVGDHDVEDLWSFIEQLTTTLGHIDGEGHCETTVR